MSDLRAKKGDPLTAAKWNSLVESLAPAAAANSSYGTSFTNSRANVGQQKEQFDVGRIIDAGIAEGEPFVKVLFLGGVYPEGSSLVRVPDIELQATTDQYAILSLTSKNVILSDSPASGNDVTLGQFVKQGSDEAYSLGYEAYAHGLSSGGNQLFSFTPSIFQEWELQGGERKVTEYVQVSGGFINISGIGIAEISEPEPPIFQDVLDAEGTIIGVTITNKLAARLTEIKENQYIMLRTSLSASGLQFNILCLDSLPVPPIPFTYNPNL